jgi:hypothetical protein
MGKCEKCLYYKSKAKCGECVRLSNAMDNNPMFTPNTNYDRIKSMSVEEMAGLIVDFHFVFQCKSYGLDPKTTYENMSEEDKKNNNEWEEEMRPIWEQWLLQEVSENDTTRKES